MPPGDWETRSRTHVQACPSTRNGSTPVDFLVLPNTHFNEDVWDKFSECFEAIEVRQQYDARTAQEPWSYECGRIRAPRLQLKEVGRNTFCIVFVVALAVDVVTQSPRKPPSQGREGQVNSSSAYWQGVAQCCRVGVSNIGTYRT